MKVFLGILIAIFILLGLYSLYFAAFAVYGFFQKELLFPEADEKRCFAVLIPARNEERVIGDLVDSLMAQQYPKDRYEVIALVNQCTDATEEVAKVHGAAILPCEENPRTKGEALAFAFKKLKDREDIDSYVIFDADNVVDPSFLTEMNKALAGAPMAQGFRTGKNEHPSWVADCYEIYYAMQDCLFNHPKACLNMHASISGTGWAIKKEVVDQGLFKAASITEDYEYTLQSALYDVPITYCSRAVAYDEFTEKLPISMRQRVRWTFGMLQNLRLYEKPLLEKAGKGSKTAMDMAVLALMPVGLLASVFLAVFGYAFLSGWMKFPVYVLVTLAQLWVGLCVTGVLTIAKTRRGVGKHLKGIVTYPLFILTWIPVLFSCLFRRNIRWKPITHGLSKRDLKKRR